MITSTKVRTLPLPTGRDIPVLGQGTWHMGENPALRPAEIAALRYGIDLDDLVEAHDLPGGEAIATDQVLYNLVHRGIEWDLLPWCRDQGVPIMAYSPIEHAPQEQKPMLTNPTLLKIASEHEATPAQVALAWVLHQSVVAIPKAASAEHVGQNREALDLSLTKRDLKELDRAFPPPSRKVPLATR